MHIAVAGNPNAGKSTLFNALTGARAHIGNYPGVTIERREAITSWPGAVRVRVVDLPGCYSLTARSPEEEIAHQALLGRLGDAKPDVVLCVVDATNLARGLYLVLQLLEAELPVVLALNMIDVARHRGIHIDAEILSERLGVPVVATSARHGEGLQRLRSVLTNNPKNAAAAHLPLSADDAEAIATVRRLAGGPGDVPATTGEALWLLTSNLSVVRGVDADLRAQVEEVRSRLADPEQLNRRVIACRYDVVDAIVNATTSPGTEDADVTSERLDRILLHPLWGFLVFGVTMVLLFQAVFAWAEPLIAGIETLVDILSRGIGRTIPAGLTRSLLIDGLLAGVGNVLVFLPQIALLFLGLSLLEESGYMARAAFLLDRVMHRVGLHGKAFIPLMSSFACAVPGVMATRTIESTNDRLVTLLVAPFMSCSARMPVYVLVIAAVFSPLAPLWGVLSIGGLVIAAMYFLGFVAAIATAWVLKRSVLKAPTPALLLELPAYQMPLPSTVLRSVYERCRVFLTQTGTTIVALSIVLWGLLTFPRQGMPQNTYDHRAQAIAASRGTAEDKAVAMTALERENDAIALGHTLGGRLGHAIEPLVAPLGFDWRIGVGLIASFAAREVLVSTLGQVYALGSQVEADSVSLRDAILADRDPITQRPRFTALVGLSLMVFFVLAMQCLSTLATVRRETNSWRWPLAQLIYMNTLAYGASLAVFQLGSRLGWGT